MVLLSWLSATLGSLWGVDPTGGQTLGFCLRGVVYIVGYRQLVFTIVRGVTTKGFSQGYMDFTYAERCVTVDVICGSYFVIMYGDVVTCVK